MLVNKESLNKDLKNYVIEFTLKDKSMMRLSLRKDFLSEDFNDKVLEDYYADNPNMVVGWKIDNPGSGWRFLNVNDIVYTQIIDGY